MLTRRTLLHALPLLLVPRLAQAQWSPHLQPSSHPLNHPASCLAWWLAHPLTLRGTRWEDLLRRQVGTCTNMGLLPSCASGPRSGTTRRGGFGEVRFDGVGASVAIPSLFGGPPALTVAAWVRLTSVDGDTDGADVWNLGDNVVLRMFNTGTNALYRHASSGWYTLSVGTSYLGTGWHHLAYVCDPAQARQALYVDGVAVGTTTQTTPMAYDAGPAVTTLGVNPTNTAFDFGGALDDVRVYRRALEPGALRLLYTEALAGYPQLLSPPTETVPASASVATTSAVPRRSRLW